MSAQDERRLGCAIPRTSPAARAGSVGDDFDEDDCSEAGDPDEGDRSNA